MSGYLGLSATLEQYLLAHTRESDVARRLRQETVRLPNGGMITMPDQAAFLALLVRLLNARRIIEIGTFTGYGSLAMAQALPLDGTLIACDISREWADIARRYWKEAGVESRIDLRIAPALDTLKSLPPESFDLIFVDADKTGYDGYYEIGLKLLRTGGLMAFDNMIWGGAVADTAANDPSTLALKALNEKIFADSRVDACLLTIADGMVISRKR